VAQILILISASIVNRHNHYGIFLKMKANKKTAKTAASKTPAPESKQPKGKKLLLFKTLAILTPFIILFFLELILRLCDYGDNTDLFIKYPLDGRYMVMNYYASEKFFPDTLNSTVGNQEVFTIKKAPNTVRIFVLGESTTIGFPFVPNGSFHRWLQFRLMQMYPDKNFEIINLSLTAVNSYTVLNFGKQLAQYQPDAVLIYTGHNEYYGALGVGSTTYVGSSHFMVQTLIALRGLKIVQLFNNGIQKLAVLFKADKKPDGKSLMEDLAAHQHIAYGSADYQAGITQFTQNMTELCSTLNDEKIPVFLSTVVSNEKDQPPFVSAGTGSGSAAWNYKAGQLALSKGSYDTAKQYFDKAKELDELRFRAPEAINTSIKNIAAQFPYVHLVDTKSVFEQHSPNGITGHETIMEHVHPNLFGYALMSDAFYQAIQKQQLIKGTPDREISFDELLKEMPITKMDSLKGAYQIMMLKTGWPFNQPISKQFRVDYSLDGTLAVKVALGHLRWDNAMGQLYRYDKKMGYYQAELKVLEGMVLQYPQTQDFYGLSGVLNANLKNYNQAAFYYRKLFMLSNDPMTAEAVYQFYLKADDPARALTFVQYNPAHETEQSRKVLIQIVSDKAQLNTPKDNLALRQQIAADYTDLGMDSVGYKYFKKGK